MRKATNDFRPMVLTTATGCNYSDYARRATFQNQIINCASCQFQSMVKNNAYWSAELYSVRKGVVFVALLTCESLDNDFAILFDKNSQDSVLVALKTIVEAGGFPEMIDGFISRVKEVMPLVLSGDFLLRDISDTPSDRHYNPSVLEVGRPPVDRN